MRFVCCQCGAELPGGAAWATNRDRPVACEACGVRQYATTSTLGFAVVLFAGVALSALASEWLAARIGVDRATVLVSLSLLFMIGTVFFFGRRRRMVPWVFSRARALAWLVYMVVMTGSMMVGAATVLLVGVTEPGPLATIEGKIERVSGDSCLCLRLDGRADRFVISADVARKYVGDEAAKSMRPGARIRIAVPEIELASPVERARRVQALTIGADEVFTAEDIARDTRRRVNVLGVFIALFSAFFGWATWRRYRVFRGESAAGNLRSISGEAS